MKMKTKDFYLLGSNELDEIFDRAEIVILKYLGDAKNNLPKGNSMPAAKAYSLLFENLIRAFSHRFKAASYIEVVVFATILANLDYQGTSSYNNACDRRKHFQCDIEDLPYDPGLLVERLEKARKDLPEQYLLQRTFQASVLVRGLDDPPDSKVQKVRIGFRIPRGVLLDILEREYQLIG